MATWSRTAPLSPDLNENARPDRLFDAYVFDLDGTIYLGDRLLPGVAATIGLLRPPRTRNCTPRNSAGSACPPLWTTSPTPW